MRPFVSPIEAHLRVAICRLFPRMKLIIGQIDIHLLTPLREAAQRRNKQIDEIFMRAAANPITSNIRASSRRRRRRRRHTMGL